MTRDELERKIQELGATPSFYSLDGELIPDRIVLSKVDDKWTVFYFDERGNKDDVHAFSSEEEAYDYIYFVFERERRIMGPFEPRIKAAEEFRQRQK